MPKRCLDAADCLKIDDGIYSPLSLHVLLALGLHDLAERPREGFCVPANFEEIAAIRIIEDPNRPLVKILHIATARSHSVALEMHPIISWGSPQKGEAKS